MHRHERENKRSLSRFLKDIELSEYYQGEERRIREAHKKFLEEMEKKKMGLMPMYEPKTLFTPT